MGTDMQYVYEVYNPKTNMFEAYNWKSRYALNPERIADDPFFIARNYAVYSLLGGVCQDEHEDNFILSIDFERGIPHNACDEIILAHHRNNWGEAHNAGYATLKELLEYDWDSIPDKYRKDLERFRTMTIPAMQRLSDNPENVRIVFFFDS